MCFFFRRKALSSALYLYHNGSSSAPVFITVTFCLSCPFPDFDNLLGFIFLSSLALFLNFSTGSKQHRVQRTGCNNRHL